MKKLILTFVLIANTQAFADSNPLNATMLGVDNVGVTDAEYQTILSFVESSKDELQRIHDEAYGMPSPLALEKYIAGVTHILSEVRDGTKLIPAIIMAQGLNFVADLPAQLKASPPALRDENNPQLKLAILKAAVLVAENYYYGKRKALRQQILVNPPYMSIAEDLFDQSLLMWPSVMDTRSSIRYMHYTVLHTVALIKMMPQYLIHFRKIVKKAKEFQMIAEKVEATDGQGHYLVNGLQLEQILREMKYDRKGKPGLAFELRALMHEKFSLRAPTVAR